MRDGSGRRASRARVDPRPRPLPQSGPRGSCAGRYATGAAARARSPSFRVSTVPDLPDDELHLATRTPNRHLVATALAQERPPQRGFHAHQRAAGIDLVGADDLVRALRSVLVLERDPGAE